MLLQQGQTLATLAQDWHLSEERVQQMALEALIQAQWADADIAAQLSVLPEAIETARSPLAAQPQGLRRSPLRQRFLPRA